MNQVMILINYRQQSDYEDLFVIEKEIAIPWISQTKEFVNLIEKIININRNIIEN